MMTPAQREFLETTRRLLDNLDDALIDVLAHRAQVVDELWRWKDLQALPRTDPTREAEVVARLLEKAKAKGLDEAAVRPILEAIVGHTLLARR